ncbi:cysteine synthase A [Halomicroarcula limicola]|uniref:Cysteine synthase A n=1 Tax=Haloarcula limicola TaxID=1429915 RepID=A0A8J8C523_9EURY|nr:cysteine synthase A [Halomicroarcula limicola]MBV0925857.1 cysteine synthase A [Halomicroarcula limicola]
MDVASDVTELVGETPLLRLDAFAPNLLGKVEAANPGGSVKDRVAVAMLERARETGHLEPGGTVVEPTSGNTGIGLAVAAAAEGYDLVLTMPESMSEERRDLLRALGADLVLTPADGGMAEAVEAAEAIADERENSFVPQQFANLANPRVHRETTGPEIWRATDGEVDAVVAGVGTGGTITGVSAALKADRDADVQSVAVEPADSAVLSGGEPGGHSIQGIGAGFVPEVLRTELLDGVRAVESDQATAAARRLASEQGLLVGISSGAALAVAERIATDAPEETVVVVLPDTGERYLSTGLFA